MYLKNVGRPQGGFGHWNVPEGEKIASIEYYYDKYVNALTFITDRGSKSPTFGTKSGANNMLYIPADQKIIGNFGRSGWYVN